IMPIFGAASGAGVGDCFFCAASGVGVGDCFKAGLVPPEQATSVRKIDAKESKDSLLFMLQNHPGLFTDRHSNSATSITCTSRSPLRALTPSPSIVMQNGQPTATTSAPVSNACRARSWLTRLSFGSSTKLIPPPPPQQNPCSRLCFISTVERDEIRTSCRGASKTAL